MKNKIIDFCLTADKILILLLSFFLPFAAMAWIYSVAYYFNSRLPQNQQVNSKMLNFLGLAPAICFILIFPLMFIPAILVGVTENPIFMIIAVLILPVYLLLFASIIIMIYQAARAYSHFEKTRRPPSQDFIIFLLIFWIQIAGILMLQDDISKFYAEAPAIDKPKYNNTPTTT